SGAASYAPYPPDRWGEAAGPRFPATFFLPTARVYGVAVCQSRHNACFAAVRPGISSEAAIVFKDRVQQNLGAGCAFLKACRFRFVVADALEAGDEDHGGRSHSRDIDRIMAGAGHHIARCKARFLRRPPDAADQFGCETNGG